MEILENIELILTFSRDRSFQEYERDTKTIYAVSERSRSFLKHRADCPKQ